MDDPNLLALLTGIPPQELQNAVIEVVGHYNDLACGLFGRSFPFPTVSFGLRGKTAGQAAVRDNHIKLNLELLLNPATREQILEQTVPHEVAHLIHHQLYPRDREWHGNRWKFIMREFGLTPDRCHTMPVKPARKTRKFEYDCPCGAPHRNVGLNKHRKIQAGEEYVCKYCRGLLINGREI
jgi:SprT protein